MLTKENAKIVLDECLTTGADYAEIFYEDTLEAYTTLQSGKVENINTRHVYGAGIRILKDSQETYGYTSNVSLEGLLELGNDLKKAFIGEKKNISYELKEETNDDFVKVSRESKDVTNKEKIAYLRIVDKAIKDVSNKIIQRIITFVEHNQHVIIANTKGKFVLDTRNQQRIAAQAVASDGTKSQSEFASIGGNFGIDEFKNKDLVEFGTSLANTTLTMLDAPEMVGGVYSVIIHNGFGGVLFHEACGHSLEATAVAKGLSVFTGKLGEKIASSVVTAIDDGTISNEWGSLNYDDEGNKTKKNVLIENGILKSYMIDYRNSLLMKQEATGNSRRESYRYSPTSRMTNTYIANGESTFEEIIENTKYGLFCKSMGGGSVNPTTGEFNFSVSEGYMVEDGKITHPVRGATLIGNGATALLNIDMVANNQTFGHGMCGSSSGSIHANVGQPTIRILNMTVGGTGGNK